MLNKCKTCIIMQHKYPTDFGSCNPIKILTSPFSDKEKVRSNKRNWQNRPVITAVQSFSIRIVFVLSIIIAGPSMEVSAPSSAKINTGVL